MTSITKQSVAPDGLLEDERIIKVLSNIANISAPTANLTNFDKYFWLCAIRNKPRGSVKFASAEVAKNYINDSRYDVFRIGNVVMQGGGLLGLAHAGFILGLEKAGVRFAGLAGTSAGSIAAMGILAVRGDDPLNKAGEKLVKLIDEMPMASFIDGNRPNRILIKRALEGRKLFSTEGLTGVVSAVKSLILRRGLNSGTTFQNYFDRVLSENGLATNLDVDDRLNAAGEFFSKATPHLQCKKRQGKEWAQTTESYTTQFRKEGLFETQGIDEKEAKAGHNFLKIIATAMPIGLAIRFPRDFKYFDVEYKGLTPALMVRASMSIPLFFEPIRFWINKRTWAQGRVSKHGDTEAYLLDKRISKLVHPDAFDELAWLDEVYFLDGGLFSNLPTDSFNDFSPDVATISVSLLPKPNNSSTAGKRSIRGFLKDASAVVNAIRLNRDREFYEYRRQKSKAFESRQKELHKQSELPGADLSQGQYIRRNFPFLLADINTGSANWLNFNMEKETKVELLLAGLRRAELFLSKDINGDEQDAS